jgi:hypothetical protein
LCSWHWLHKQFGPNVLGTAVVTTGTYAYRRSDGIAVTQQPSSRPDRVAPAARDH